MAAQQQTLWKLHKKLRRRERHGIESKSDYIVFALDHDLLLCFFYSQHDCFADSLVCHSRRGKHTHTYHTNIQKITSLNPQRGPFKAYPRELLTIETNLVSRSLATNYNSTRFSLDSTNIFFLHFRFQLFHPVFTSLSLNSGLSATHSNSVQKRLLPSSLSPGTPTSMHHLT